MPIVSRFFGIVIYMYWDDHSPPHFHAKYQDMEVTIDIETGKVTGMISNRAMNLLQEWRSLHIDELLDNWHRCKNSKLLKKIQPLE